MAVSSHSHDAPSTGPETKGPVEPSTDAEMSLTEEAYQEGNRFLRERFEDRNSIVRTVRLVGGAMVTILLVAVVLNEIFGSVNVGSGPFSDIGSQLESTGVAAMGLLIVGLLVVAANRIMGIFGGSGGM